MILWIVFRRRLRVATCFVVIPGLVMIGIFLNLALRDKLPAWFEFSAISSENLTDAIKFWYIVGGLFQAYDFKVTLFLFSPLWLILQYFEILAKIDI
jgi:hypothetical protein